jgi:ribonucleoside-diphosphate reductase alpha chain
LIIRKHAAANDAVKIDSELDRSVHQLATQVWQEAIKLGEEHGYRNAQASVLAPTGTIGLMMDCDTTGIEPDLALVKFKKMVGGGSMQIVNQTIPRALRRLGYTEETVEAIVEFIAENGNIIDAPGLKPEHYSVFDCAMGVRSISPMGHVKMMAAAQPFLSGAISKTVNMPSTATVEEVEDVYYQGWKYGLKALAIYRDNCKVGQPLSDASSKEESSSTPQGITSLPIRQRLPKSRAGMTTSFSVAGAEGYMTTSAYADGRLGEVFLKMSKQGSTLAGIMDAFSIAVSIGLQYGVPLDQYVQKFTNMRFEPSGMTDDEDVRMAQSVMDYIFRRLALDYLPEEHRSALGIFTAAERKNAVNEAYATPSEIEAVATDFVPTNTLPVVEKTNTAPARSSMEVLEALTGLKSDAPLCMTCGVKMRMAGSCFVCEGCGNTSGCS